MASKRRSKSTIVLPNEIWLEIFEKLDSASLLNLTLVCKHWNKLIFSHMADRFVLKFDMDQLKFPQAVSGMVPDRHYRHLCVRSFRLNSLNYLLDIVGQLAADLDSLKLCLQMLECQILDQLLPLCKRLKNLNIKFTYFEHGETIGSQKSVSSRINSLKLNVQNHASTYKPISLEKALWPYISKARQLDIVVHGPQDLDILRSMASELKVLKATVDYATVNMFFKLRLPALTSLDLSVNYQKYDSATYCETTEFQQFLGECKDLKSIFLEDCEFDQACLSMIYSSLPKVDTLQLCGYLSRESLSLNGIEKMKQLKTLGLPLDVQPEEFYPIVPLYTVEHVSCDDYVGQTLLLEILRRFPNLKSLTFPINVYEKGLLILILKHAPQLKSLCVFDMKRITQTFIEDASQLVNLEKLTIKAQFIGRDKFRSLWQTIILPALRTLKIKTTSDIPDSISGSVASKNPLCKLILNKQLVKPVGRYRSSSNRKRPSTGAA